MFLPIPNRYVSTMLFNVLILPFFTLKYSTEKAFWYIWQGDYANALAYYNKRLALADQKFTGKHYQKAVSLYKTGAVYAKQHKFDQALQYYQQAIVQLVPDFNTKDILTNPPLHAPGSEKELLEVFLLKAEALHEIYNQNPKESYYLLSAINNMKLLHN